MISWWLRFAMRHPVWIIATTALVTLFFVSRIVDPVTGKSNLHIDPSLDAILPDGDESRDYYNRVVDEFGNDQSLILALVMDDVFTPENLRMIERVSDRIEAAEGVDHVVSLATANHILSETDGIRVRPFLADAPVSAADALRVKREVLGNPVYAGNLVSRDGRATALIVYTDDTPETEFTDRGLDLAMLAIAQAEVGDAAEVLISGTAFMRSAYARAMRADLVGMLPLVVGVLGVVGLLTFHSLRGVLLPLGTILIALTWTLGTVAWMGLSLNVVTTFIPVLLLTVGFAYAVHMVSDYYLAFTTDPAEVARAGGPVAWALQHVTLPIALTGLTTVVGFFSLTLSSFPAVRQFGWTSVLGVVATAIVALTFAPAVLCLLPPPRQHRGGAGEASGPAPQSRFDRIATWVAEFDLRRRRWVVAAAALVAVVSCWGMTRVEVSTHLITNFAEDDPVRMHFESINRHLEGARPFSIVFETDNEDAFIDPEMLRQLDEMKAWLVAQPEIGGATTLADSVKLLNRAFHDDDPDQLVLPEDPYLIRQLLLFADVDDLLDYADAQFRVAHIHVRSNARTTQEISALVGRIEKRMAELPPGIRAGVTGNTVVLATSIDAVAKGQIQSLAMAVLFIYGILAVMFASLRVGFYALLPNVLPVLVFFGALGIVGVGLNATTGLIACIVIGIAVDDTIHFLTRFNVEARRQLDEKAGAVTALCTVARPVTATSVALCLGFLVFTTGEVRNQVEFGALASFVLGFAWLADVTFTPALVSGVRVVSMWDVLTFDLGLAPQASMPIFRGMSTTQARIAALMTHIVTFPAGAPIFRAGDVGEEVYAVVDGELLVSMATARGREELERARRGDVVGEVALYHGKRTADVDALTDVRLLCLTKRNLDRLRLQYPRIGGRILWNLSQVLAARMARVTERAQG